MDVLQTDIEVLLDRTEESSTKQITSTNLLETESLNLSSIASDDLSTTAIHFDRESRRSSTATFEFDHIIADSRIYQRTLASNKPQTFKQFNSTERNVSSIVDEKLDPSTKKLKKLLIDVVESVDVETSESTDGSDRMSNLLHNNQNLNSTHRSNLGYSVMIKATKNAFVRNTQSIKQDLYGKTFKRSQQHPLELVVTGYGKDKLSLVKSVSIILTFIYH